MLTGSKELIRDINSHLVLETIVNNGSCFQSGRFQNAGAYQSHHFLSGTASY